jgi:hypothetical protein
MIYKDTGGDMRHMRIRRILSCAFIVLTPIIILATSCTKSVRISNTDLRDVGPGVKGLYRITTLDGHIYEFKVYSVANDTLTIHHPFVPYSGKRQVKEVDVSVPFHQIKSIERVQWDPLRSFLVIGAIASLPFLLLLLMGPVSAG